MPAPPKHVLSKSTFMYGCQCSKRLWLHKFRPGLRDKLTEEQASVFKVGTDIGMLARQLFPYGVDASPETPYKYQQSVFDTARYIRKEVNVIYEAAFQFDGILVAIDIMVKKGDKWYAFEVKGTGSVKLTHIQDAALQYHVITQSGTALEDISIVHLNNNYVPDGELDIQQLFTCASVVEEVKEQQPFVISKANELMAMLKLQQVPAMAIGDHCSIPYPCDFYGFCSKADQAKKT